MKIEIDLKELSEAQRIVLVMTAFENRAIGNRVIAQRARKLGFDLSRSDIKIARKEVVQRFNLKPGF